jgi:hypothetical protein
MVLTLLARHSFRAGVLFYFIRGEGPCVIAASLPGLKIETWGTRHAGGLLTKSRAVQAGAKCGSLTILKSPRILADVSSWTT